MIVVAAFYRFMRLAEPAALIAPLAAALEAAGVVGTVLLAPEGVNGTLAGSREAIDAAMTAIRALSGCAGLRARESMAPRLPFTRLKVRLKREIVTMGQPQVDPAAGTGAYVAPADWNALIAAPDVVTIDTRNDFEVAIGSFDGAVDPKIGSFRDFPAWWEANAPALAGKRIAMFCTGGIRCEKSTNYLLGQGVTQVFHLQGGILGYLGAVAPEESLWQGECFVFDDRVAVGHGLAPGTHTICHACRRPLSPTDKTHSLYEPGCRCAACADEYTDADRARFRTRHRQRLAAGQFWNKPA